MKNKYYVIFIVGLLLLLSSCSIVPNDESHLIYSLADLNTHESILTVEQAETRVEQVE